MTLLWNDIYLSFIKSPTILASFFDRPIATIPKFGIKINLGFPSSSIAFFSNFLFFK